MFCIVFFGISLESIGGSVLPKDFLRMKYVSFSMQFMEAPGLASYKEFQILLLMAEIRLTS